MSPSDRDKKQLPAVIDDNIFDEDTRPNITVDEVIASRAKRALEATRHALAEIASIKALHKAAVRVDQADHKRITDSLNRQEQQNNKIESKVDSISTIQTESRIEQARTSANVERLIVTVESNQAANLRVTTAHKEAVIGDTADIRKTRRAFWYKVAMGIVPIVTAAAVLMVEHC